MPKPLIQFTDEQQGYVRAERAMFNSHATALDARSTGLMGNSIGIPIDAWRRIDGRAQMLARSRLAVFARLAAASTLPVDIGDLVNYYPQVSDSNEVTFTMDGRNGGKVDQAITKFVGTPLPIITTGVRMGWRQMAVLRKAGGGTMLDITSISNAQRKGFEALEDLAINGRSSIVVGTDTIYGLRTLPQRNTGNHGFTLATTATGANWLTAFTQAINAVQGDNHFGRVTFFINQGDFTAAETKDYATNYTGTILQRLRAISTVADIIPASNVPANEILGIADLDAGEWGAILSAMPLTTRPKTRMDPEEDYVFGVMAAQVPQFRTDYNGQCPFVHLSQ